jgi:tetratricopeptide (TPR) repeat protein
MHYKGTRRSLPEIARELNVDAVVEGTVVHWGNRVRLSVQLIDAPADQHLWAENYEEDTRDIVSLENNLTRAIAKQIRTELAVPDTFSSARPINPEAQDAYLRGRYYLNQGTSDGLDRGFGYFQQAVAIDPNYALGYAGLADAYILKVQLGASGASPRQVFPQAKAAAEKALQLDDTLAESHATLGYVKAFLDRDWPGAEAEFKAALQLNPGYAVAHYYQSQSYLMPLGQTDKAIAEAREAVRLDPLSVVMNDQLGAALFFDRQYDQAVAQFQKTIALNENIVSPHWMLMLVYEQKRMYPEAVAEFQRVVILSGFSREFANSIGAAYTDTGPKGYWRKRLQMLDDSRKNGSPSLSTEFAVAYAQLGNTDQAVHWLERANNEDRAMGSTLLNVQPAFDGLRSNPRFQSLSHGMNFPAEKLSR